MSGSGRKSHYRKNVVEDFLNSYPIPIEGEEIVRVITSRGTNIFEIETIKSAVELALMPSKFRKLIWIKRGDFLIVSGCEEPTTTTNESSERKVRFMIKSVLNKEQIKHLKDLGLWPVGFDSDSGKRHEDILIDDDENIDEDYELDDESEVDAKGNTICK